MRRCEAFGDVQRLNPADNKNVRGEENVCFPAL